MPLPNRVDPFGELLAVEERGTMLGNRGGKFHRDDRTLGSRRFVSRQWICCRLEFNGRRRVVWGNAYTELFFLDEVTAFAAGHRPCFECRRRDAETFAELWARVRRQTHRGRAAEMDTVLHQERLDGCLKRQHRLSINNLPEGAIIQLDDQPWAVRKDALLLWTPSGYRERQQRPTNISVAVLTPPSILDVLSSGYPLQWHKSADTAFGTSNSYPRLADDSL